MSLSRSLIVGLGNPGSSYEKTRHNLGFRIVQALATKYGLNFRNRKEFRGELAEGSIEGSSVFLLKPLTYMNQSGEAVHLLKEYFQIDLSRILVVVDDVELPLGALRMRINSGPGTHNGLKSVEWSLKTIRYARLRVGVGRSEKGDLADYVLSPFSLEEERLLPEIVEGALRSIEIWLEKGITSAMDFANRTSIDSKHWRKDEKKPDASL